MRFCQVGKSGGYPNTIKFGDRQRIALIRIIRVRRSVIGNLSNKQGGLFRDNLGIELSVTII